MNFWHLWGSLSGLLLLLGYLDYAIHRRNLNRIKVRINVNGTRGKSTVTRLIMGALREGGLRVVGKTTGTAARLIYWNQVSEVPIPRKIGGPNINEQCWVLRAAARQGAEYLVSECMAVNPEYQVIFARQLLQNNLGVIVNTLPDHLDVMGPTTREVAEALAATIPTGGTVVLIRDEFLDYYTKVAEKRSCQVRVANPDLVPAAFLNSFNYLVFPENVALALEVAHFLGIETEVAMRGMLKALPDPGVLTITPIKLGAGEFLFANAFAANDPVSTIAIYERLASMGYREYPLVIVVNCREDRVDRTKQMAIEVLPHLAYTDLVIIGSSAGHIKRGHQLGWYNTQSVWNLEGASTGQILECLTKLAPGSLILGIGNIHGAAAELLERIYEARQEETWWLKWRGKELAHI
jgi:gamma-polyglutamate synthase